MRSGAGSLGRVIGPTLVAGEGAGSLVAVAVIVVDLLRRAPVPDLAPLLVLSVPLVGVGQWWMIRRARERTGSGGRPRGWAAFDPRTTWRWAVGDLDVRISVVLVVLVVAGWLSMATAFSSLDQGGPGTPAAGCPYRLSQHGGSVCVSRAEYDRAGAAEQRLFAGALLSFFSVHTGAALGGLSRVREDEPT